MRAYASKRSRYGNARPTPEDLPKLLPYRLPRRALGEEWTLRIHPDFLDCTVFVCIAKQKHAKTIHVPVATGFIVEMPDFNCSWRYVVTARHCIEDPGHAELFIRVNTVLSAPPNIPGYVDLPSRQSDWFTHPTADVAAILLPLPATQQRVLRYTTIKPKWFIDSDYKIRLKDTEEQYSEEILTLCRRLDGFDLQPGDDIFFYWLVC